MKNNDTKEYPVRIEFSATNKQLFSKFIISPDRTQLSNVRKDIKQRKKN